MARLARSHNKHLGQLCSVKLIFVVIRLHKMFIATKQDADVLSFSDLFVGHGRGHVFVHGKNDSLENTLWSEFIIFTIENKLVVDQFMLFCGLQAYVSKVYLSDDEEDRFTFTTTIVSF